MKPSASLRTPPEFAIFSSIGRGSADPTGDTQDWPFAPDEAGETFRSRPLGRHCCIRLRHIANYLLREGATDRAAIRAPEYQNPFSAAPESPPAASLSSVL